MIGSGSSAALHYVHCDCLNNYSHFDLLQEKTKTNKQTHMQYASLLFHGFFFMRLFHGF